MSGRLAGIILCSLKHPRKKLLLAFVAVIVCIAGFLTIEHFRGAWMLKRWKARMATQGEELIMDRLVPRNPPPEENGLPQLVWIASQLGSLPAHFQPTVPAYALPGKAVVITKFNEWPPRRSARTNLTWVRVAEQLAPQESRLEAALETIQAGVSHANLNYRRGFGILLPHLARLKGLAQFLSAAALHDLHQGQPEPALAKLKGILALAESQKDEPIIISQIVRATVMQIGFNLTWELLQYDCWSEAQLAELQTAWARLDFLTGMEKALSMERSIVVLEFDRIRSSELSLGALLDQSWGGNPAAPTPSLLSFDWVERMFDVRERIFTPLWIFAWSEHDELHFCKSVQDILKTQREARLQKSGAAMIARVEQLEEKRRASLYDNVRFLVSRAISGALGSSFRQAWRAQATREIALTAIALKRYELRHQKLPAALAQLVPEFLPQPPVDYMDGQPLRYCLDSDSTWLVYSVGLDGHDDGGDATISSKSKSSTFTYQNGHDLVWPQPATQLETAVWLIQGK